MACVALHGMETVACKGSLYMEFCRLWHIGEAQQINIFNVGSNKKPGPSSWDSNLISKQVLLPIGLSEPTDRRKEQKTSI